MNWEWILWGFKFWMLFDVLTRRRGPIVWIALFLMLPAIRFGGIFYLVLVKAIDWGLLRGLDHARRGGAAVEEGDHPPAGMLGNTTTRRLETADQLELREVYPEAIALFESVLQTDPENLRALHGLARCQLGTGHPKDAAETLERVLEKDREFSDYAAALDYAEALHQAKRNPEAVELLEGLVKHTGRLNHRVALAHYLAEAGHVSDAVDVLQEAKSVYLAQSDAEQEKQRRWFEQVEQRLQTLAT